MLAVSHPPACPSRGHPSTSHVGAGDARPDAAGAAHHGAARGEHQQGLQAAGELCPVLGVDLRGETGAGGAGAGQSRSPGLPVGTAGRGAAAGSTLLVCAGRRRWGSFTILCSLSISC